MTALADVQADTKLHACLICREPSHGNTIHPCCDYWAQRGYSRCPACREARAAEHRREQRAEMHRQRRKATA